MDEKLTAASVSADVRRWVLANWDPSSSLRAWRTLLLDSGWAVPSWPERWYGKGMPAWADVQEGHAVIADLERRNEELQKICDERLAVIEGLRRAPDPISKWTALVNSARATLQRARRAGVGRSQ